MAAARLARRPHRLERRSATRPPSACSAPSTCSTSPTGCTRRSARASARRRSTTSSRCASRSGRRSGRGRCTGASTRTPPARATSSSSTPRLHGRRRRRSCSASSPSGSASRPRASSDVFTAEGAGGRPRRRRTSSPSPRSSRARTSRRSSRRTGCSTASILLAVAGGEGWGEQPVLDDPRVRRLGFVPDEELAPPLPRRGRRPSTRRASRASGCRSSRRWRAARRSSPRRIRRMDEACGDVGGARRPATIRRRSPRRSRSALARARASSPGSGIEHAARFTWRAAGETMLAGYEEARS